MALPRMNETPRYTMTIPSTGQEVKFRPYLVKEEKILLIASESQDTAQIIDAIEGTVSACVNDEINLQSLSTFDLEYMFMKIRSKSVGEKVEMTIPCVECETPVPFDFDLDDIRVDDISFQKNVKLTDDISIDLRWPSYNRLNLEDPEQLGFEMITATIEAVCTPDERIIVDDEPKEEVVTFLESLTTEQFKKISNVVEVLPRVYFLIDRTCSKCGTHVNRRIEGLQNFFQ